MKITIAILITTGLTLAGVSSSRAQEAPGAGGGGFGGVSGVAPPPQPAPAPPVAPVAVRQPAGSTGGGYGAGYGMAAVGPGVSVPTPEYNDRLQAIVARAGGEAADKPLVIRFSPPDPAVQASLEEDLGVMAHILEKAAKGVSGGPAMSSAMGVNLWFAPGAKPGRDLYLEGYGAVFMLRVPFPLLAPPPKNEESREEVPPDSAWEEAKRELHGQPPVKRLAAEGPSEPYSEEKLNTLKDGLLDALKCATHIRELRPDDSVTVCVFGNASPGLERQDLALKPGSRPARTPPRYVMVVPAPRPGESTVLVIQVSKADIERFAKGKMELREFRHKAKLSVYAAELSGPGAPGFGGMGGGFGGGGRW